MDIRVSFTYQIQIATFCFIKHWKKDSDTKKCNELVEGKYDYDEKQSAGNKFEEQIVMDIINSLLYDHIKQRSRKLNRLSKPQKKLMTK